MYYVAKIASYLFHPLLLIFYSSMILLYPFGFLDIKNVQIQWIIAGIIFLLSYIVPVLFLISLKALKIISNLTLEDRLNRYVPYFFSATYYAFVGLLMKKNSLFSPVIPGVFLFASLSIFLLFLLNIKWKVSAHSYSMAALTGLIVRLVFQFNDLQHFRILIVLFLVLGLVATSRLYLKAHKDWEVYTGIGLGLVFGILSPTLFWIDLI
jgi:hypothetical protein